MQCIDEPSTVALSASSASASAFVSSFGSASASSSASAAAATTTPLASGTGLYACQHGCGKIYSSLTWRTRHQTSVRLTRTPSRQERWARSPTRG